MAAIENTKNKSMDTFIWVFTILLILSAIVGNGLYSHVSLLFRVVGLLLVAAFSLALVYQTQAGKAAWQFAQEAQTELRKVVWPTREETTKTTGIIMVMVCVLSVILWSFDAVLLKVVAWLTGYGA